MRGVDLRVAAGAFVAVIDCGMHRSALRSAPPLHEAHFRTAEPIVEQEAQRFTKEWARRRNGPVIEQLTRWCETRRQDAVQHLLSRLRGKLSDADCAATEKAFSRFQNQFLHGPIRALTEETHAGAASGYTLAEALLKLFRLPD